MTARQHFRFGFLAGVMHLAVWRLGATVQVAPICRLVPPA